MRRLALISWLVVSAGCVPVREPAAPPAARAASHPPPRTRTAAVPPGAARALEPARLTRVEGAGIAFEGVAFDARRQRLVVADQEGGPGSQFPDAATAGRARGGLAAVNAGFFTPTGEPLGLVVAAGRPAGAWNNASSLGSGVWCEDAAGRASIIRRERLGSRGASSTRELIQAGPLLVENGRPVTGLNAIKPSIRTLILWDGGSRWWIGQASGCTLAQLGSALGSCQPAGWPVRHALNLDGGRSAELWASSLLVGGPLGRRAPWNRPVRNFLILVPR
ncbi:MAG: phosphodiester glycosidase family protein [Verrucomicrobiota bacterium]